MTVFFLRVRSRCHLVVSLRDCREVLDRLITRSESLIQQLEINKQRILWEVASGLDRLGSPLQARSFGPCPIARGVRT